MSVLDEAIAKMAEMANDPNCELPESGPEYVLTPELAKEYPTIGHIYRMVIEILMEQRDKETAY